jgi:hypothetical protein
MAFSCCVCWFHNASTHLHLKQYKREITGVLWHPKVHYRVHRGPLVVPILSQMNPFDTLLSCFSKIHFNIILPSLLRSSKRTASFMFLIPTICVYFLSVACYITRPSHPRFHHPLARSTNCEALNYVTFSNLIQSIIVSSLLSPNIVHSTLFLNAFSFCSSLRHPVA